MAKEETRDNSYGITSAIMGILSLVLLLLSPIVGIILAIIGLVFASKQNKISKNKWSGRGKVLCIIGIILAALSVIFYYLIATYFPEVFTQLGNLQK